MRSFCFLLFVKLVLLAKVLSFGIQMVLCFTFMPEVSLNFEFFTGLAGSLAVIAGILSSTKNLSNLDTIFKANSFWYTTLSYEIDILPFLF